ncbi:MAG: hypothetical protein HYU37_09690 [Acidobacteria bacterium]|nr:hypothetical protein [Acidobacteriota bacterium]
MKRTRLVLTLIATTLAFQQLLAADGPALAELENHLANDPENLQLANAYRRSIIESGEYDRALRFFARLVETHTVAANAYLSYGFAHVDKIPTVGAVTQVVLAGAALSAFTRAVELRPSWIAYYTRGSSYLFWPKIFGRAPLGVADLEEALRIQQREPKRPYHVRTFLALGDGYWKVEQYDRARATWEQGLKQFPESEALRARITADAGRLAVMLDAAFDPTRRVDTDLSPLWNEP